LKFTSYSARNNIFVSPRRAVFLDANTTCAKPINRYTRALRSRVGTGLEGGSGGFRIGTGLNGSDTVTTRVFEPRERSLLFLQ
jgi:hypothetical protein